MNKYERLRLELETSSLGKMKCFGNSMLPILKSGSLLTFKKEENYKVKDIVFCKSKRTIYRCTQNCKNRCE